MFWNFIDWIDGVFGKKLGFFLTHRDLGVTPVDSRFFQVVDGEGSREVYLGPLCAIIDN